MKEDVCGKPVAWVNNAIIISSSFSGPLEDYSPCWLLFHLSPCVIVEYACAFG